MAHPQTAHIQPAWPTFAAMAGAHATQHGDALALIGNGREMNWREFEQQTLRASRWLAEQGVGPGDRVAVWLANHWEWLVLLLAQLLLPSLIGIVSALFAPSRGITSSSKYHTKHYEHRAASPPALSSPP